MEHSPPYSNSSTSSSGDVSPRGKMLTISEINELKGNAGRRAALRVIRPARIAAPRRESRERHDEIVSCSDDEMPSGVEALLRTRPILDRRQEQKPIPSHYFNLPQGFPILPNVYIPVPKEKIVSWGVKKKLMEKKLTPDEECVKDLVADLTRKVALDIGQYMCCFIKVGTTFKTMKDVENYIIKLQNHHPKEFFFTTGYIKREQEHKKTHQPQSGDGIEARVNSILEREFHCTHGGPPMKGYEAIPKCPCRFYVKKMNVGEEDEHFVVTEANNLHEWHTDPVTGDIPGFDYTKVKITMATVTFYKSEEEYLEYVRTHSTRRMLYDRYKEAWVPKHELTTKPPYDPRKPRCIFPRCHPFHYARYSHDLKTMVIPPEWLPVGWHDYNAEWPQEHIDGWNKIQQERQDDKMEDWTLAEKNAMKNNMETLLRQKSYTEPYLTQSRIVGKRQFEEKLAAISKELEEAKAKAKADGIPVDHKFVDKFKKEYHKKKNERLAKEAKEKGEQEKQNGGGGGNEVKDLPGPFVLAPYSSRTTPPVHSNNLYSGLMPFRTSAFAPLYPAVHFTHRPLTTPEPKGDLSVRRPLRLTGVKRPIGTTIPIEEAMQRMAQKRRSFENQSPTSQDDDLPSDVEAGPSGSGVSQL